MKISTRLIFLAAIIIYLILVVKFWFVCDDAYISFRYSKNLAEGLGLTYNTNGGIPVEGYSNFLLVLAGSFFERLSLPIDFWIPLLSACCGLGLLFAVFNFMREQQFSELEATCAMFALAIFPPFFIWSSSGMEAVATSFFLFQAFRYLIFKEKPYTAMIFAILLSLIRAEGICWAIFLGGLGIFNFSLKRSFQYFIPLLTVFSCYFVWRYNYFQELLPNTVVNKVGMNQAILERGFKYAAQYFLTFLTPLIVLPASLVIFKYFNWKQALAIFCLTGALLIYPVLVGGDFMTMFRFYAPLFPIQVVLTAVFFTVIIPRQLIVRASLILATGVLAILPAFNLHLVSHETRAKLHIRHNTDTFKSEVDQWKFMKTNSERWQELGKALKLHSQPGDSLVAGAIGNVGYFSGLTIYDRFGLVEPRVAKREVRNMQNKSPGHDKAVPAEFFLKDQPTFLKAYLLIGDRNRDIPGQMAALTRKKISNDYQPVYYPLKPKLHGKDLGLLVLKRVSNDNS